MKLNKNLSYQQKSIIKLLLTFLTLIIVLYFLVFIYTKKVVEANVALSDHRVGFETKLIKEEKLSRISKNLSEIETKVKNLDKTFIDENSKLEFITMLERMAEKNLVALEIRIDFNKIDPKNKTNQINLVLNGSYVNIMSFLIAIENLNHYFNINNININSNKINTARPVAPGLSSPQNNLMVNINATTYWK